MRILSIVMAVAATATSVLATPTRPVPDSGSTALLLGISALGVILARRFSGKR